MRRRRKSFTGCDQAPARRRAAPERASSTAHVDGKKSPQDAGCMENGVGIWEGAAAARAPRASPARPAAHAGLRAALGGGAAAAARAADSRRGGRRRAVGRRREDVQRVLRADRHHVALRVVRVVQHLGRGEGQGRVRRAEQAAAGGRAVARADLLVEVDREAVLARGAAPPFERRAPRRRRRRLECDGVGGPRVDAVGTGHVPNVELRIVRARAHRPALRRGGRGGVVREEEGGGRASGGGGARRRSTSPRTCRRCGRSRTGR